MPDIDDFIPWSLHLKEISVTALGTPGNFCWSLPLTCKIASLVTIFSYFIAEGFNESQNWQSTTAYKIFHLYLISLQALLLMPKILEITFQSSNF